MDYGAVVRVSAAVAATPQRSAKIALLADLLRQVPPGEAPIVVGYLVGEPRQGRIGVGWATLRDARVEPAEVSTVQVAEIDRLLDRLAVTTGSGSQRAKEELLVALMERLTADEQVHLVRTMTGEMRQGANDGVVAEAVAKAGDVVQPAGEQAHPITGLVRLHPHPVELPLDARGPRGHERIARAHRRRGEHRLDRHEWGEADVEIVTGQCTGGRRAQVAEEHRGSAQHGCRDTGLQRCPTSLPPSPRYRPHPSSSTVSRSASTRTAAPAGSRTP